MGQHLTFATPAISVYRVDCPGHHRGWSTPEEIDHYGLVLIRQGVFLRRVNGVENVAERSVAYIELPGQEQQVAHPAGGDACTWISFHRGMWCSMFGDIRIDAAPVHLDARQHLWHLLLTRDHVSADPDVAEELAIRLVGASALPRESRPRNGRRSGTNLARKRLVDQARQALASDPNLSLVQVATQLAVSPHHLSRVFSAELGRTFSRHRSNLRIRLALDRLLDDEPLSRVAADTGFADHGHLTRAIKTELGETPSVLRRLLRGRHSTSE